MRKNENICHQTFSSINENYSCNCIIHQSESHRRNQDESNNLSSPLLCRIPACRWLSRDDCSHLWRDQLQLWHGRWRQWMLDGRLLPTHWHGMSRGLLSSSHVWVCRHRDRLWHGDGHERMLDGRLLHARGRGLSSSPSDLPRDDSLHLWRDQCQLWHGRRCQRMLAGRLLSAHGCGVSRGLLVSSSVPVWSHRHCLWHGNGQGRMLVGRLLHASWRNLPRILIINSISIQMRSREISHWNSDFNVLHSSWTYLSVFYISNSLTYWVLIKFFDWISVQIQIKIRSVKMTFITIALQSLKVFSWSAFLHILAILYTRVAP